MLWFLYNVLFTIGYVLMLPRFIRRMLRRGGYGPGFGQRFGRYDAGTLARLRARRRLWVHAVSVGEVFIALRFMRELRSRAPEYAFVLTTNTSTGRAVAEKRIAKDDILLYVPADFPWIVRRALRAFAPAALILTESELWPNMMRLSRRHGARLVLVNGRITDSSYRGYRRLRVFFGRAVRLFDLCFVQTEADRARLEGLGAAPARVRVVGSAKYDGPEPDPAGEEQARLALREAGFPDDAIVLLGGSTWPGEEAALLDVYRALKPRHPELRLVLVPRHVERRAEIEAEIGRAGLTHLRRSALNGQAREGRQDVVLVDTTGEMMGFYAAADIVFVGKSLTEHGGQNFVEPAALGKPVLTGPNLENFPVVAEDFRRAEALLQVATVAELQERIRRLLADPSERAALGERARSVVAQHRGVLAGTADAVVEVLRSDR